MLSKVFESCLLRRLSPFLTTSGRQFGFKKGVGCNHAIFTVRKTIDYFTSNRSTVNICTLDVRKAFDVLNHNVLFMKLMDRNAPIFFIKLLRCWYSKVYTAVKWGSVISDYVRLSSGVRQGGILSPYLFAVFVDDILNNLSKSGLGCYINCVCFNSFMYADDVILLSLSLHQMQLMINFCLEQFDAIGMNINVDKSGCMRIGERHNACTKPMYINNIALNWNQEIRYLGINILSGRRFNFNMQNIKQKYFRALNGIFGKVGLNTAPDVLCSLIDSQCVPILLFAAEALNWNKKLLKSLENAFNQAFFKIFKTFDKHVIEQCQFYMGYLPVSLLLDVKKLNFHTKIRCMEFNSMHIVVNRGADEYTALCSKYYFPIDLQYFNFKRAMWTYFERSLLI